MKYINTHKKLQYHALLPQVEYSISCDDVDSYRSQVVSDME